VNGVTALPIIREQAACERVEQQVRCYACDKFLTKTITTIYYNPAVLEDLGMTFQSLLSRLEIQIRFGTETKCPRCKELDSKLIVAV